MELYIYIIIFAVTIVLILAMIFFLTKNKKTQIKTRIDFEPLLVALGGITNIKSYSNIQSRVKIIINDIKKVSAVKLKDLNIPATLKSQELTLLMKGQSQEFINFIKEREI